MTRLSTQARAERRRFTLRFPFKGIDGAAPLSALPEGACPEMLNVFPRVQDAGSTDVARRRYTGGRRPGLTKATGFSTDPQRVYGLYVWETVLGGLAYQYLIAMTANGVYRSLNLVSDNFTPLSGSTSATRPTFAQLGQRLYMANSGGATVLYYADSSLGLTAGAQDVLGILGAGQGVNLCCAYRGRLVIANSYSMGTGSQAAFAMSKVGDPTTFNTSGTNVGDAYLGNATGAAGVPGDRIAALIPFADEYLIFGGATYTSQLRGDPRFGGRVTPLSLRVGVLDRLGWCFDGEGTLWFLGSDYGLYRLPRGAQHLEEVLHGRGDAHLAAVLRGNSATKAVQLVYDPGRQLILILIVPFDQSAALTSAETHLAYHPGLDAPFPFSFPVGMPPFCAVSLDEGPVLFGGASGSGGGAYSQRPVAYWDPGAQKLQDWDPDSGSVGAEANFTARVRFPAVEPDAGASEWRMDRFEAVGGHNTGSATAYWLTGRSADEVQRLAYASAYDQTFTLFGAGSGYQGPLALRARGAAHQLVVEQTGNADLRFESFAFDLARMSRQRTGA